MTQGYTTEEKCSNWPLQRCTLQKQKVKKYSPETECKKVPFELCGPAGCPVEPGQEQCQDRKETVSGLFYVLDFFINTDFTNYLDFWPLIVISYKRLFLLKKYHFFNSD